MAVLETQLFQILKIGHETSMRGLGISLREARIRTDYVSARNSFGSDELLPLIEANEFFIEEWLLYSEDKRTTGGWAINDQGELSRIDVPQKTLVFDSLAKAVAEYVVRELDFWAGV